MGALKLPNGYPHALNSALNEQLRDIYALIKGPKTDGAPTIKLEGLGPVILNLRDILNMDRVGTRSKLIELLKQKDHPPGVAAQVANQGVVQTAVQYAFDVDKAVEAITKLINTTYESLMKKERLEEQLFDLFGKLNTIYTKDAKVDDQVYAAMEADNYHQIDLIVRSLVDDFLKTAFDPPVQDVSKLKETYISELKGYMQQIAALGRQVDSITFTSELTPETLAANLAQLKNLMRQIAPLEASIVLSHSKIQDTPNEVLGSADKTMLSKKFAEPLSQRLGA